MVEKDPATCEYLENSQLCKAVLEEDEGKRTRGRFCSNSLKNFCCYLCAERGSCEISCTYLDEPEELAGSEGSVVEDIERRIKSYQDEIGRLAVLLAESKIREESYLVSAKALESRMEELKTARESPGQTTTAPVPSAPSGILDRSNELSSLPERPTALWYLVPFFFGIIGGIVAYVGTKNDDKEMADGLLIFGIVWSLVLAAIGLILASVSGRF